MSLFKPLYTLNTKLKETSIDMIVAIYFIFNLGAYLSRSIHSIWFEMNNQLELYTITCISMSVTGLLSFLFSKIINRYSFLTLLILSSTTFGVGLIFRTLTFSWYIAIFSGVMSGMGISLFLMTCKTMIYGIRNETEKKKKYGDIGIFVSLANLFGTILATNFVSLAILGNHSITAILLSAGIISGLSWIPYWYANKKKSDFYVHTFNYHSPSFLTYKKLFEHSRYLFLFITIYNFLSGLAFYFIHPFFAIFLNRTGIDISHIGIITSVPILLGAIIQKNISLTSLRDKLLSGFFYGNISLFTITIFIYIYLKSSVYLPYAIFMFYIVSIVTTYFEKIIELNLYPKQYATSCFGLALTFNLIGNIIGTRIGGTLLKNYQEEYAVQLSAITFIIALSAGFVFLFKHASCNKAKIIENTYLK